MNGLRVPVKRWVHLTLASGLKESEGKFHSPFFFFLFLFFFHFFFLFLFFYFYLFIFSFIFISWTLALQGILPCLRTSVPPGGAAGGNLYILIKGTGNGPSLLRLLTSFHGAHSSGRRIGIFQFPTQTGALPHRLCCFPKLSECGGQVFHPRCKGPLQGIALLKAGKGRSHRTQMLNDGSNQVPPSQCQARFSFMKYSVTSLTKAPREQGPRLTLQTFPVAGV